MFDIGFMELLLVALIALIVLGPERLPKAAYSFGLIVGRVRRGFSKVQQELEQEVHMQELREKMQNPYASFMDEAAQTSKKQPSTSQTEVASASHTEPENPSSIQPSSSKE